MAEYWRVLPEGLAVAVRVTPRARRLGLGAAVAGPDGPLLTIGVREPAEDGRANKAVCALMANALGVPTSAVTISRGATSRRKQLRVAGDPAILTARVVTL